MCERTQVTKALYFQYQLLLQHQISLWTKA